MTASPTKPPPADTGTPVKDSKKPDKGKKGNEPPDKAKTTETTSTEACIESEATPTPIGMEPIHATEVFW